MTGVIHSENRRSVRILLCALAAISLLIAACSGGGNEAPATVGQPVPQPVGGLVHCAQTSVVRSGVVTGQLASPTATATPTSFASCLKSSGANVEVGSASCPSPVLVESSATAGTITVDAGATLYLGDTTLTLNTTGIVVNGLVEACFIGQNSLTNQVTINFIGGKTGGHSDGITVNSGGTLRLRGVKGSVPEGGTSWTSLSCPAGPAAFGPGNGVASPVLGAASATCPGGPLTIQVAASVAKDWQPGDWIVVGTTDFVEHNSEFVQIQSLSTTTGVAGTTITLNSNTPLTQYHFGGPQPDSGSKALTDDFTKNYGIDERAEVGLITRNIKLTATVSSTDLHSGGEINLQPGSFARLWGAEIEKFGKPQLGSYPVNFIGGVKLDPPPLSSLPQNVMDSDSIHHSYNHGIVLSSPASVTPGSGSGGASGLNFANNVVARVVGHLFYLADGNEVNNQFINNLGLAAMSNSYTIPPSTDALAKGYTSASAEAQFFWVGDYLTNNPASPACALTNSMSPCNNGYDELNIPNTDCDNPGAWATGFYITNPNNTFTNNSIGGCQGQGRGFWYLPFPSETAPPAAGTCPSLITSPAANYTCNTQQVPANKPFLSELFANNRVHACYTGLDTASDSGTNNVSIISCPLAPQFNHDDVYTQIEGMTATRNRNRGIWVRPGWYVVDNARVATNRDSITVVSSGGTEGSPPGEWSVVSNSILAGISANNPRRFGPCPYPGQGAIAGGGGNFGCLDEDQVTGPAGGHGYPVANWNMEGEMLYDGPARLTGNVFVNFLANPANYLTAADQGYLGYYEASNPGGKPFVYEGDAAFGWFQSNVNSYPPTQYSENDTFPNTDLRHQVYTADVNLAAFADGDKNTVLLDESPTPSENLAGYQVVAPGCKAPCTAIANKSAISFNNLPFVSTPNAVDECLSEGQQDTALENRPTALMSPQDYATLEFSMQTLGAAPTPPGNASCPGSPPLQNCNNLTFAKDQLDFGGAAGQQTDGIAGSASQPVVDCPSTHSCINLVGRNQTGVYEPKVINGLGYTVLSTQVGIQPLVDVTFTDPAVAGGMTSRVVSDAAITAGENTLSSASAKFTQADMGRQVLIIGAGSSTPPNNPNLFTTIATVQSATGATLAANAGTTVSGATATIAAPFGIRLSICYKSANGAPASASSFAVTTGLKSLAQPFPGTSLTNLAEFWNMLPCNGLDLVDPSYVTNCFSAPPNQTMTALDPSNSLPLATALAQLDPTHYYYNPTTGFLTFLMQQVSPNGAIPTAALPFGGGPSPLASCGATSSDPCPDAAGGETFYSCPEGGCPLYTVDLTDSSYKPGLSSCTPYGVADQDYTAPWPTNLNQLDYLDGTPISTTAVTSNVVNGVNFPHITDNNPTKACAANPASVTAPWTNSNNPASSDVTFTLGLPSNVCILSISPSVAAISSNGTPLVPLASGQSYTFTACDGANQCSQAVKATGTPSAPAFTAATGSCGIPPSGMGTIPFAAGFTAGTACTCPS